MRKRRVNSWDGDYCLLMHINGVISPFSKSGTRGCAGASREQTGARRNFAKGARCRLNDKEGPNCCVVFGRPANDLSAAH